MNLTTLFLPMYLPSGKSEPLTASGAIVLLAIVISFIMITVGGLWSIYTDSTLGERLSLILTIVGAISLALSITVPLMIIIFS